MSNTHKQKQLFLLNLNELCANFKFKYVSTKIGFSNFVNCCQSGVFLLEHTTSVCVCTYHQTWSCC